MPMTKWKLSLLLLSVAIVALLLSGCFLPPKADNTGPTISVSTQSLSAESGLPFTVQVSAQDPSGIEYIQATFMGKTEKVTSSPASFTFDAPHVTQAAEYTLTVTAVDNSKNHNSTTREYQVVVWPTESGTLTTSVQLNNANGIYVYPVGPQESGAVLISAKVLKGAELVKSVNVFVDGKSVPSTSTASAMSVKAAAGATSTEAEWTFFYPINAQTAGPHTYYAVFYGENGNPIQISQKGWFYITYPSKQSVELGTATPLYNSEYLTGNVSFTATVTDYTSNYEALLIEGPTPSTKVLVSYPATNILSIESATKIISKAYDFNINTASLTDGSYTFKFVDRSIDGATKYDSMSYVVDNTPPTLVASYRGHAAQNGAKLYVGISPNEFDVYVKDANFASAKATIENASLKLPVTLTNGSTNPVYVDRVAPSNGDTATFTAYAKDLADHEVTLTLSIVRDTQPPSILGATITGLATVNGVVDSANGTITVTASVTDKNLKSVAFMLDGPTYIFPMTKNASTGLWTATVDVANVLPGDYQASIIATDLALNTATHLIKTIHVYRKPSGVFTTSLETNPNSPVNGYVKSATITVTIDSNWIYAIKKVYLMKGSATADTLPGTPGSETYYFNTFSGTGTYHVVVEDTVNATYTDGETYTVKIDSSSPTSLNINPSATAVKGSPTFTVSATDTESGVAALELQYETFNGDWDTIGATSSSKSDLSSAKFTWNNLSTLPDGKYSLRLIAIDGVGNVATKATYVVNDSTGKPNVTFTPTAKLIYTKEATHTFGFSVANESDVSATLSIYKGANTTPATQATYTSNNYTSYPYSKSFSYTFSSSNATYTFSATVVDEAANKATHTTVFVYDTMPASFNVTVDASTVGSTPVVKGNAKVEFTIKATDNLSGIASVKVYDPITKATATAKLDKTSGYSTGTYGQIATATYIATVTAPSSNGVYTWHPIVEVYDNAGNVATKTKVITVDPTKPIINITFQNSGKVLTPLNGYIYSSASPTVYATVLGYYLTHSATYVAGSGSASQLTFNNLTTGVGSFTSFMATWTDKKYSITVKATDGINGEYNEKTVSATVVISNAAPEATVTIPATHLINYASSQTSYIATYTFKSNSAGIPLKSAALILTYGSTKITVWSFNNTTSTNATQATGTINLQKYAISNGATYTLTAVATDYALNTATSATKFYVDVVRPKITNVYKTSGSTGTMYIQFSEAIATTTSFVASDIKFVQAGLTFYATQVGTGVKVDNSDGLIIITEFVDSEGNVVYPSDIGGTWNVYVDNVTDLGKNPIANNGSSWDIHQPSAPKPVNP